MADSKITALAAAGAITGAEIMEMVKGGVNVQSPVSVFTPAPEAWIAPTLLNLWANLNLGYAASRYRKRGTDVEIEGILITGVSGTVAFTLPAGYRPTAIQLIPILTSGGNGFAQISTNGDVTPTQQTGNATALTSFGRMTFSTL